VCHVSSLEQGDTRLFLSAGMGTKIRPVRRRIFESVGQVDVEIAAQTALAMTSMTI